MSPYGRTKMAFEDVLHDYATAYGLCFVALRYFNAAGADDSGECGELHSPEIHLIPLILRAVSDPTRPVSLLGIAYNTPDGTCIRDFTHVNDLADAHVAAVGHLLRCGGFEYVNLGTVKGHSVLEIINAVENLIGLPVPRRISARRSGDPSVLVADVAYASERLGWSPSRSLQEIIHLAWRWHIGRRIRECLA